MGSGVKVSSAAGASPPGQLRPKRLVSLLRNGWSDSTEMGGQLGAKRVVRLERNTHGAERQAFGRHDRIAEAAHEAYRTVADRLTSQHGWSDERTLVVT